MLACMLACICVSFAGSRLSPSFSIPFPFPSLSPLLCVYCVCVCYADWRLRMLACLHACICSSFCSLSSSHLVRFYYVPFPFPFPFPPSPSLSPCFTVCVCVLRQFLSAYTCLRACLRHASLSVHLRFETLCFSPPFASPFAQRHLKAKGQPGQMVAQLAESYKGYAPMCSLVEGWLQAGPG
jgi:hypothetical protein